MFLSGLAASKAARLPQAKNPEVRGSLLLLEFKLLTSDSDASLA